MIVLEYIKDIYRGKDNLFKQLSVFSILGILTVVLNNYAASLLGNVYMFSTGFVPSNEVELYIDLFLGILIYIFSIGYFYTFVNKLFGTRPKMPEISLSAYYVFIKILPMLLIWCGYGVLAAFIGFCIFRIQSPFFCIYYSILICLVPFANIILYNFARDFKYTFSALNPFHVFKIMDKTLGNVILLTIETLIIAVIPAIIVWLFFHYAAIVKNQGLELGMRLGGMCIAVYFIYIIQLIYAAGLVKISERNIKN